MTQIADAITSGAIETFREVGAVAIRNLLSRETLQLLESGVPTLLDAADDYSDYYTEGELTTTSPDAKARARRKGQTLTRQNGWVISPELRRFLHESVLAQAAATLLGSKQVRLYEDLLIYKAAGTEQPTPWHQDDPQWPLVGRQMCSAWFCLDRVDAATGALRFATGSHQGPRYRPYVAKSRLADLKADEAYFEGGEQPDVEGNPQKFKVVSYDTEPGDVVFFHPRLLHAAYGSNPAYPRRTFSIRFLGDDVRWEPKKSVMYEWLAQVKLKPGEPIVDQQFPMLWPRQSNEPRPVVV